MPSRHQLAAIKALVSSDQTLLDDMFSDAINSFYIKYRATVTDPFVSARLVGNTVKAGYGQFFQFNGQSIERVIKDILSQSGIKLDLTNLMDRLQHATGRVITAILSDHHDTPCISEYVPCAKSKLADEILVIASVGVGGLVKFNIELAKEPGHDIQHLQTVEGSDVTIGFTTTTTREVATRESIEAELKKIELEHGAHQILIVRLIPVVFSRPSSAFLAGRSSVFSPLRSLRRRFAIDEGVFGIKEPTMNPLVSFAMSKTYAISNIEAIWLTTAIVHHSQVSQSMRKDGWVFKLISQRQDQFLTWIHNDIYKSVIAQGEQDDVIRKEKRDVEIDKILDRYADEVLAARQFSANAARELGVDEFKTSSSHTPRMSV